MSLYLELKAENNVKTEFWESKKSFLLSDFVDFSDFQTFLINFE